MKIELYKLQKEVRNFDLDHRIRFILAQDLSQRIRPKGSDYIRLETAVKRDGLWLIDFILMRTKHGPAKVGISEPATGFSLDLDEGFGEETAFLWDTSNDWCVAQYNHHGIRSGAIADYLGAFDHQNTVFLGLSPKIDPEVHSKVRNKKLVTKFTVSLAPQAVNDYDYDLGAPLNDAINKIKPTDAERIEISISANKRRGLAVDIENIINRFRGHGEGAINGAHAVVRTTMDDKPEVIDLLSNRVITLREISAGTDKRFPMEARWNALLSAHHEWRSLMI